MTRVDDELATLAPELVLRSKTGEVVVGYCPQRWLAFISWDFGDGRQQDWGRAGFRYICNGIVKQMPGDFDTSEVVAWVATMRRALTCGDEHGDTGNPGSVSAAMTLPGQRG